MVTLGRARICSNLALVSALMFAAVLRKVNGQQEPVGYQSPPWGFGTETPPSDYQATDAPPPPTVLNVRLMRPDGSWVVDEQQGIVQLFSPVLLDSWGSLCVNASAVFKYGSKYDTMAKLICRQLGLPQRYARLLPASSLPPSPSSSSSSSSLPSLPTVALVTNGVSPCPGDVAATVADCDGLLLQPTPLECGELEQGDKEPAAVVCTGSRPPTPPAPLPPPPRAPPARLTTRLVDPATGQPAAGLRYGRLEVLQEGSWGTVCGADPQGLSDGLAQYACLQAGEPGWRGAGFAPTPADAPTLPASVPVWLVAARDCRVAVEGAEGAAGDALLDCGLLAGPGYDPRVFLPGGGLDEASRLELLDVTSRCALGQPSDLKHLLDVFVECPEPPEPPSPSAPPAQPQRTYDHGIAVQPTEVRPGIYDLSFVQEQAGMLVAGTVCSLNGDNGYFSEATKLTLCSNLTFGARPYGSTAAAPLNTVFPFLHTPADRKARPMLLDSFECQDGYGNDDTALPDISYCQIKFSPYADRQLFKKCWTSGWASTLLVCSSQYTDIDPQVVGARLEGGLDGTTGRLEVLLRDDLQYDWGTVCDDGSFTTTHAQAVCRDLGLDWSGAEVLAPSAAAAAGVAPPPPSRSVLMTDLTCESNVIVPPGQEPPQLSFVRDCSRAPSFLLGDCPADNVVAVRCVAAATGMPSPPMPLLEPSFARSPSPPQPAPPYAPSYGGHYLSPPPLAPPPPYYPVVPVYLPPPPAPHRPPRPPLPCAYGGYYGHYGCHDDGNGGYGGYGGYGAYGGYGG